MSLAAYMHSPAATCGSAETLAGAAREMEANNVGSLLVVDGAGALIGIVTDRDVALAIGRGRDVSTPVEQIMSPNLVTISDQADPRQAAAVMDSHGIRRLPVQDASRRPVGVVSLDDLFAALVDEVVTLQGAIRAQRARH